MDLLHIDIEALIRAIGYLGLFAIVFAESGLFFGFFLPGGSLLFTAGLLSSQGYFNIYFLVIILAIAAITGDSVGYWFGHKVGPRIFNREDSKFFHKKHIEYSRAFYERHGAKAIILGRFIPIARTFVPILAGIANMNYRKFLTYNIIGGLLWACNMSLLGFFLGRSFPQVQTYLLPIILTIIVISFIPLVFKSNHGKV